MKQYDLIIIGAGISGMSLAHHVSRQGKKTLVIEKEDEVGGSFATSRLPNKAAEDFWIELGAHTCYNSYGNLLKIIEDLGITDSIESRTKVPYKVLIGDETRSIFSQVKILEALPRAPRLFFLKKEGLSVEEYYSKIVGRNNYQNLFAHFFNAVPSQRTNKFPADILFKKRARRKDFPRSFTMKGGLQSIPEAIADQKNIEIATGIAVKSAALENGVHVVVCEDGAEYSAPVLALAAPVTESARLLEKSYPEIAAELKRIEARRIDSTGVAVEKGDAALESVAGVIPVADAFFSLVSRDVLPHDRYRGFTFHFKPDELDFAQRRKRIGEVIGALPEKFVALVEKSNTVPSLAVGHDAIVKRIDQLLSGKKLLLTGNFFKGLAIEDCVSRSVAEAERLIGQG